MAYEQKDNTGVLFQNTDKKSDNHPDRTGTAMVNGKMMEVSGWLKTSAKGTKYLSLSFREPRERTEQKPKQSDSFDDDIPF